MERREYTRVRAVVAAELTLPGGQTHGGVTGDLSFGGVYLDCDEPIGIPQDQLPQSEDGLLRLTLTDEAGTVSTIELRCQLVGTDGHRAGLRLTGMEPEYYQKFRDFLLSRTDNPEKLLREISCYPKKGFPREPGSPGFMDWLRWALKKT